MDIELLVSEIFACPSIWSSKDPYHSDRVFIAKQWEIIAMKLGITVGRAKMKFKILKDQFRKELKKVPSGKSEDPELPMEEYLSMWPYFRLMFFLRDEIQKRKTIWDISKKAAKLRTVVSLPMNEPTDEISSDILEEDNDLGLVSPQPIKQEVCFLDKHPGNYKSYSRSETPIEPLNKRSKTCSIQEPVLDINKPKVEWPSTEEVADSNRKFILSLLPLMKKLPPKKLSEMKIKYMTLLHEAIFSDTV